MKKLVIIGIGILLLGTLIAISSCSKEDDGGFATCSNTCSADKPYSNATSASCFASQSECESETGNACKNCN